MKNVNKVILLGNVTRDPEVKALKTGRSVCSFGLATNRVWKDDKGERQSLPEFHTIVAWGNLAEFCGEHVKKGKPLYVEGHLKTHAWEKPEGTKHFRTEVMLDSITLLGPREPEESPAAEPVSETEEQEAVAA